MPLAMFLALFFQVPPAQPGVTLTCTRMSYPDKMDDLLRGLAIQACIRMGMDIHQIRDKFDGPLPLASFSAGIGIQRDCYVQYGVSVSEITYYGKASRP